MQPGAPSTAPPQGRRSTCWWESVVYGEDTFLAIEVKRSSAPRASRGFRIACGDVRATAAAVIHSGAESFPLGDGIDAVAAADAVAWLRARLDRVA